MKLSIKVVPGSSKNCVAGWLDDVLKVRVSVPPERGKANAAVEQVVADALGIAADRAAIVKGQTSQRKVLEISGLSEAEVRDKLSGS